MGFNSAFKGLICGRLSFCFAVFDAITVRLLVAFCEHDSRTHWKVGV